MVIPKIKLSGLTVTEIFELIGPEGFTYNHALAISNSIYKKGISDITDIAGIPKRLKEYLYKICETGIYGPSCTEISTDGSVKYLFINSEGQKFETIFIPELKRRTVCVSTQSGCRMGCRYCATGRYGFHGNLDVSDILNQVAGSQHAAIITHVVFMGMGEPLDNTDNVLKACEIMTAQWGHSLSPRNITLSTVGITPSVVRFLELSRCNLVLSLYSPFHEERAGMIPAERQFPVDEIIRILRDYPVQKKRRLSIAYVMIRDVNDSERHLGEIRRLVAGTGIRVNLLPYHKLPGDSNLSSTPAVMDHFRHELMISGVSASIRRSRGADISAACGLLASGMIQGTVSG